MRYGNDKPLTEKYVERAFKIYVLYRLSEHFTFHISAAHGGILTRNNTISKMSSCALGFLIVIFERKKKKKREQERERKSKTRNLNCTRFVCQCNAKNIIQTSIPAPIL